MELLINITSGLVVNENVIRRRVMEKLPFMATENIMMESVRLGADRQEIHEIIRRYSQETAARVKQLGEPNNLIDLLADDPRIPLNKEQIIRQLDPDRYIGRCVSQVEHFLTDLADPVIARYHSGKIKADFDV